AISALAEVLEPRKGDSRFRLPPTAGAWDSRPDWKGAWSSLLRSLGDWYSRQRNIALARSLYDAAVSDYPGSGDVNAIDIRAMLPLIRIAVREGNERRVDSLLLLVNGYSERVVGAKSSPAALGDLSYLRYLHLNLGTLFVEHQQWAGKPASAVTQLERMRATTARIAEISGEAVRDPPESLEPLLRSYRRAGMVEEARRLEAELTAAYPPRREQQKAGATRSAPRAAPPRQATTTRPPSQRTPQP
ncbi:MAG TPA: hypothetical protein VKA84_27565, partial [Gemmatimonadaceae bacterium]|nr:hypothetical protein [Gemmatimonadaceae bacterium]